MIEGRFQQKEDPRLTSVTISRRVYMQKFRSLWLTVEKELKIKALGTSTSFCM